MMTAVTQLRTSGTPILISVVSGPATASSSRRKSVTQPAAVPNTREAPALITRATPRSSRVPASRSFRRIGLIFSGGSSITPRRPSRSPAIQPRDVITVTTAAITAVHPRPSGFSRSWGSTRPVPAVHLQQAGRTLRHAADDGVQQGRLAAQHQPGNGEARGQQAGDGEEHVEADAGAHQRAVLEVVVLPGAHGPERVQPGEQPLDHGQQTGHRAAVGPPGFAPLHPFLDDGELQRAALSGKRLAPFASASAAVPLPRSPASLSVSVPKSSSSRSCQMPSASCS